MNGVPRPQTTAARFVFLECDRQGRILWMNERALACLGPAENLFDAVSTEAEPAIRALLWTSGRYWVSSCFRRSSQEPVSVQFCRLFATSAGALLGIEIRCASQRSFLEQPGDALVLLQTRTLENYFRLLQLQQMLAARAPARWGPRLLAELEKERTRLGRELHAEAGQALAGIKVHLELLETLLPNPPEPVRNSLNRIALLAKEALNQLRAVSQRLYAPDWKGLTLREALETLWNTIGMPERFEASLDLQPLAAEPSHSISVVLYRSAQEALANIIRHSNASRVRLSLQSGNGKISLVVEDNGAGFDAQRYLAGAPLSGGIGLRSMRDQIQQLGGEFSAQSGSEGTRINISLPLVERDE